MFKNQKGASILVICIVVVIGIIILAMLFGGGSDNSQTSSSSSNNSSNSQQTLHVGDTWTVDGQWKLTIHSVTPTNSRNQYSEKKPAQVLLVTFSYENLGYYNTFYNEDKLFFDLNPDGDATVIDSKGELAYSYPADQVGYAQETPVGAKCVNAQAIAGLNNISDTITMNISKYDGNGNKQTVKYVLDVK